MHSICQRSCIPWRARPWCSMSSTPRVRLPGKAGRGFRTWGRVRATVDAPDISWALQEPQLGTGHAVAQALPALAGRTRRWFSMAMCADPGFHPQAPAAGRRDGLSVLTIRLADPRGYGRIVRAMPPGMSGASSKEKGRDTRGKAIRRVNTGIMAIPSARLGDWLGRLSNTNAQGEYYLTDIVALAVAEGSRCAPHPDSQWEVLGVNSKVQLAELERVQQRNLAGAMMIGGCVSPTRTASTCAAN